MKKLDLTNQNYLLGVWYVAVYPNGTRLRFRFIGGNPPMVETEDGQVISLYDVISEAIEIIEED